ncbi:hypothetical protein L211DRAFT_895611 [Terfezia boudieri ATCC MYA-4762]|uniref:ribonuclease H n=1 Tax=Terfezia boudieri ATCC MYA-4762 TaxID=1051890 RepID=A0A3N4LGW6_9PEZI|nr:hypothetical protein L211DRAFT_895611 [Terfezia boudieri ATCC MYA-4762]
MEGSSGHHDGGQGNETEQAIWVWQVKGAEDIECLRLPEAEASKAETSCWGGSTLIVRKHPLARKGSLQSFRLGLNQQARGVEIPEKSGRVSSPTPDEAYARGKYQEPSYVYEADGAPAGDDDDIDMSEEEDKPKDDDVEEDEFDEEDLSEAEEGQRGKNRRNGKAPKLIIAISRDFTAAAWNMGAFEKESSAKKRAKSWAQKIASQPAPPPPSVVDEEEQATKEIDPKELPKGPKGKQGSPPPNLILCIIRTTPSIPVEEFAKRKQGAIRWFEKELKRCYGGRDIRVANITQERDGERKIELILPESLTRKKARDELPSVAKRIFADIKEVFWDTPVWKLVMHEVPFESRETQVALRENLESENGPLKISKRNIQRLINKGLKQKATPIILEHKDKEEAIKAVKQGVIVDGIGIVKRRKPRRGSVLNVEFTDTSERRMVRQEIRRVSVERTVTYSSSVQIRKVFSVRRSKDGRGWWQESGIATLWIEKGELAKGAWLFPEELRGPNWVAAANARWVLVSVYRGHESTNNLDQVREWWVDMLGKVMNVVYDGQRKVVIAGDVNVEDDSWLGCAVGSRIWNLSIPTKRCGTSDHTYLYVSLDMDRTARGSPLEPKVKKKVKVTRCTGNRKKVESELRNAKVQSEDGWWNDLSRIAREYHLPVRGIRVETIWSENLETLKRDLHSKTRRSASEPLNAEVTRERKDARNAFRRESVRAEPRKVKAEWQGIQGKHEIVVSGMDQEDPASPLLWQLVMESVLWDMRAALRKNVPDEEILVDSYADDAWLGISIPMIKRTSAILEGLLRRCKVARGKAIMIRNMVRETGWNGKTLVEVMVATILPMICFECETWRTKAMVDKAEEEWYRLLKVAFQWRGLAARRAVLRAVAIPSVGNTRLHLRRRLCMRVARTPGHPCESGGPELTEALREWLEEPLRIEELHMGPAQIGWSVWGDPLEVVSDRGDRVAWKKRVSEIVNHSISEEGRSVWFTEDGKSGAGLVMACGEEVSSGARSFLLGKGRTATEAEMDAVVRAVRMAEGKVLIMTDSMNTIRSLTSVGIEGRSEREIRLRSEGSNSQIMWVPGHAGNLGNEKADKAAKAGAEMDAHPVETAVWAT